jgi:hypothetical protein
MFRIANNGAISLGNSSLRANIFTFTTNQGAIDFSGTNLSFYNSTSNLSATSGAFAFGGDSFFQTTGNQLFFSINMTFVPTSGTATFASLNLSPGINQTGGANGITRGLYVNPTLTAAADWRSIEWSNNSGWGLYGAGTANNYLNGSLGIGTAVIGAKLHTLLSGNASFGPTGNTACFQNSSSGSNAYISLFASFSAEVGIIFTDESQAYKGKIGYSNNTEHMYFQTDGSERARITAAGRLLLGTTTESTFLLDVNGTARVSGAATFLSSVTAGDTLTVTSNTSTSYALNLIGRTTLGNASTINFFNNAASTRYGFVYVDSSTFEIGSITGSNIPLVFSTNQSERMRITSGGNVGIGTTSPATKLEIVGASGLQVRNGAADGFSFQQANTNTWQWTPLTSGSNYIIQNANVSIGTSSPSASAILQVDSNAKGFLPPRMTNAQRTAISSPAVGLIVYCTDATEGLYQYTSAGWANLNGVVTNRQTASYTLALTDINDLVEMNVATANNLTVPLNSSVAFPIGTKIDIAQYGAGQTTVVATSGVTVRSAGGALKLAVQYSGASLVKIGTDEWYLFGDITV